MSIKIETIWRNKRTVSRSCR